MLLVLLVLSGLDMAVTAFTQCVAKPSVPEFTVRFVNASYTVTTRNSYTGLDETELVSNNSIEITVSNQPFNYQDYQLFYNIHVRPHFEGNWTEVYPARNRTSSYGDTGFSYSEYINDDSPPHLKSSSTIVAYPVVPTDLYLASGYDVKRYYSGFDGQEGESFAFLYAIPYGGQVDFQVEILVGHEAQVYVNEHPLAPWPIGHYEQGVSFDISSGWSITQTVTIGESNTPEPTSPTSPTPLPHNIPQPTEQQVILGVAVTVAVLAVGLGLLVYLIKRK